MDTVQILSSQIKSSYSLTPHEIMQDKNASTNKLFIGVPKELSFQENRIALTPESVALLVNMGHRVIIEAKAGEKSNFTDRMYADAGAEIIYDTEKVFEADIIIKIAPPTLEDINYLKPNQTIFSPLHLPTLDSNIINLLMQKRINGIAYEYIKDNSGAFPIVRAVSEIAGSTAILIASEYLSNVNQGQGILLGGISGVPPVKVVILGAGVVALYAARTAIGLGAEVRIFDNNIYKLMRLQNLLNLRVFTSTLNPETLLNELTSADVAVGAMHSANGQSPLIVTEEVVAQMKVGAVIVDVSIDQGGCFETSRVTNHRNPTFKKHGVIHYCVPNIASRVAKTGSIAISNVITPILIKVNQAANFDNYLKINQGMRNGTYIYKGKLTNLHIADRFNLKYTNLDLLLTVRM